jgi:hypothetical protein
MPNIESKETSKRHSGNNYGGIRALTALRDCSKQVPLESQIVTERRDDAKLIVKLRNDIELLTELLQEEQDKNRDL